MKKLIIFFEQLFCKHHYRYIEINHDGMNTVECKYCGKRKSVILLLALAFVMCGCEEYSSHGPKMPFTVTKGSIRTTETSDYIATEVCVELMGIERKTPVWKLQSIQKKN